MKTIHYGVSIPEVESVTAVVKVVGTLGARVVMFVKRGKLLLIFLTIAILLDADIPTSELEDAVPRFIDFFPPIKNDFTLNRNANPFLLYNYFSTIPAS